MQVRTKLLFILILQAIVLVTAGCGFQQQSRFRTFFLPPAPTAVPPVEFSDPPIVQPNLYLQSAPAFITPGDLPAMKTRGDSLMQRASQRLERGKRYYQSQDFANARREFDNAVDLMLEAADYNLIDRAGYEKRLEEMVEAIHRYDLGSLGAAVNTDEAGFEKAPLEDILQMTFPVDPKLKDKVREQVAATVSQLPLSVNDAVLGYIHYFSNRGRRTMINGLQRAGKYRPLIQRILDEEGVPQELIHLAQAESGFYPRAMSRAKAGGMWQFLVWRGQSYGLMRTPDTDDRMDPEKATRAAARHLRDLYNEFGDWYLAIAAYNCGPVTIEKAVEHTGYADFWELRGRGVIPAETTNYVPIILAMTIMEKNAAAYGLDNLSPEPPIEYDTIEVDARTSLALVSDLTETPVSELVNLNPAMLKGVVPMGFPLHVPKGMGNSLVAGLAMVPAANRAAWRMHRVAGGDTFATIGKRYGAAPSAIMAANHITTSAAPAEGDRLLIPAAARAERTTVARASTSTTARRTAARRRTATTTASAARTTTTRAASQKTASKTSAKPASNTTSQSSAARKKPAVLTHTASR